MGVPMAKTGRGGVGSQSFIPLVIEEEEKEHAKPVWQVSHLRLESPDGGFIDINSNNLAAVTSLLFSPLLNSEKLND